MPLILNGSTGISGTDGSAGTPALQGTDGNTGMFFPAADQIAFAEGGVEAMRLDASGNVGIGTSSPAGRFDVASAAIPHVNILTTAAVGQAAGINLLASPTAGEEFIGYRNVMRFGTITGTNAAGFTERARITAGGDVLIGATGTAFNGKFETSFSGGSSSSRGIVTRSGSTAGTAALCITNPNGIVGEIICSGTTTSYNTTSDYRLKENVTPLTDAAARVQALKPCRFNWAVDPAGAKVDGFLAHEAAEVVPEAINGEKDAVDAEGRPIYQGIDQSKLVPLLTAALQEALTEIAALKARVAALEATP